MTAVLPAGFSVDWWALGVLMFEMMAGRSPFDIITDNPDMNTEDYLFQGDGVLRGPRPQTAVGWGRLPPAPVPPHPLGAPCHPDVWDTCPWAQTVAPGVWPAPGVLAAPSGGHVQSCHTVGTALVLM